MFHSRLSVSEIDCGAIEVLLTEQNQAVLCFRIMEKAYTEDTHTVLYFNLG